MLGVLLVASLTLLPWHSGATLPGADAPLDLTAIQSPGAWFGIGAALAATAAVAWLAVGVLMPRPPLPEPGRFLMALWGVALALCLLKLVSDLDDLAVGAWASCALAAALVALAARRPAVTTG